MTFLHPISSFSLIFRGFALTDEGVVSFVFILFGTCRASLNLWAGGFRWFWKVLDRYFSKRSFVPFSLSLGATISLNGSGLLLPPPLPSTLV